MTEVFPELRCLRALRIRKRKEAIMTNIELTKELIRLQDEQRKAEDSGNMAKADKLFWKIEKIYSTIAFS